MYRQQLQHLLVTAYHETDQAGNVFVLSLLRLIYVLINETFLRVTASPRLLPPCSCYIYSLTLQLTNTEN